MKKLLLITSAFMMCSFMGACQSNTTPKTVTTSETKPKKNVQPLKSDTTKVTSQTSSSGSTNTSGIKKDTTIKKTTKPKAINNSAPNQAQIDSLKKVKTKNKSKK